MIMMAITLDGFIKCGGIAMLTKLFPFCGTYTYLCQLYGVVGNANLVISCFYSCDPHIYSNHKKINTSLAVVHCTASRLSTLCLMYGFQACYG